MSQTFIHESTTTATPTEAIEALCRACIQLTQVLPSPAGLACHVAQSALETGHWRACHNWNFGNVKASPTYHGFVTYFGCNEIIDKKTHWFHPSTDRWAGTRQWCMKHPTSEENNNQCRWRAYPTIEAGAVAQLAFLAKSPRYAGAWTAGLSGDPASFSRALKSAGYYTASEAHYTRLMRSLFTRYHGLCVDVCELIGKELATPVEPVAELQVEPGDYKRKAIHVDLLALSVPTDEMAAETRAAVLALDE